MKEKKTLEQTVTRLVFAFVNLAVLLTGFVFKAYVLTQLWTWFVEPFGIIPLTTLMAAGLILTMRFIVGSTRGNIDETWQDRLKRIESVILLESLPIVGRAQKAEEDKNKYFDALGLEIGRGYIVPLIIWGAGYLLHLAI